PFNVSDNWYFDDDAQFLASRGYAVLQVNYRGSSGRGMNYVSAGWKEWGGKIINDLIDGVKWANTQEGIDPERTCTFGASFGGYASFMLAIKEPTLFKCAVGYAGIYDLASIYTQEKEKASTKTTHYFEKTMGNDPLELAKISPSHHADQIKIPVMMVHGGKDKTTELAQAEDMRDALIKAGNPPDWTYVRSEGHGFYDSENRKNFYLKLEAFLKKHLGQ
ncbi:MAG: S9 family peptidase, partial [Undibacterium sp.]|nr:S9 family peptidase [Undibacterium sp.]